MTQTIKDSGKRSSFDTGAVRDDSAGKGRFDLLPFFGIEAVAKQFEKGANKYASRNWEKGIPLHRYLDSGIRHAMKVAQGWVDEPHAGAAAWNLLCYLHTRELIRRGDLPASLADEAAPEYDPDSNDEDPGLTLSREVQETYARRFNERMQTLQEMSDESD